MTNFFIRVHQFFRSHRVVCWLSMLLLFLFFGWQASRIHLEEDIDKLMPSSKNEDGTTKLAFADLKIISSSQSFDRNSAGNRFNQATGQNMQGTETRRVSMYGNRYNFDKALKLFGAKAGYGAQK